MYARDARPNHVPAQTTLAQCYRYGPGVKSPSREFKMLSRAVNTKYLEPYLSLEGDHVYGVGFERNYDATVDSYEPATDQNVALLGLRIRERVLKSISMNFESRISLH